MFASGRPGHKEVEPNPVGRRRSVPLVLLGSVVLLSAGMAAARLVGIGVPPAGAQPAVRGGDQTSAVLLADFVGVWQRRDAWLWVFSDGEARLRWLTDWCDTSTEGVCDRIEDDQLIIGALAEMRFTRQAEPAPPTLHGQVLSTNKQRPVHVGLISLRRLADDLVELEQDSHSLVLCRPPREVNACDAV
jgi:hypothetical protein